MLESLSGKIIALLNLDRDLNISMARGALHGLLPRNYEFTSAHCDKTFILLTREEAQGLKDSGEELSFSLHGALHPCSSDGNVSIIGGIIQDMQQRTLLLDDIDSETNLSGEDVFLHELPRVLDWFKRFMDGCAAGRLDVQTLNDYKATRHLVLGFEPSPNSMNPSLKVFEHGEPCDDRIEVNILARLIYPFIFSNQGKLLSKIRRCHYCGRYFQGKRTSATFCSDPCRGGFYYANKRWSPLTGQETADS